MRFALAFLTAWMLLGCAQLVHSAPSIDDRPQAVCSYLARAANSGSLAKVLLRGHIANDPAFPHPEALADFDVAFQDLIDINNDGKVEYVYVVQYPPYVPRPPGDSTIIDELRIIRPFVIPKHGYGQQELFVFDRKQQELELELAEDETKALADDADRYRFLRYGRAYYLLALAGDDLSYVQKFDRTNTARPVCAFEKHTNDKRPQTRALTTYRWLDRSFKSDDERYPGNLWAYAFERDDFAVAELLVKNGRSANERVFDDDTLLVSAIREERADIVEWLLKHGADPSIADRRDDTPLWLAVRHEYVPIALKLIQHGADPRPLIDDIADLRRALPEQKRSLMLATIDALGYVPEEFVLKALDNDPSLLESFVTRRAPVRPLGVSLRAGEPMKLPFYVDRAVQGKAAGSAETIEHIFRRGMIAPKSNFAIAGYGSYSQGVQIMRYDGSNVSDEDFLLLATALCYYFMPYDCGAEQLVVRARAWADAQLDLCPASIRSVVNDQACRVVSYYTDARHTRIHAFNVSADGGSKQFEPAVQWKRFLDAYRAKHGSATPP